MPPIPSELPLHIRKVMTTHIRLLPAALVTSLLWACGYGDNSSANEADAAPASNVSEDLGSSAIELPATQTPLTISDGPPPASPSSEGAPQSTLFRLVAVKIPPGSTLRTDGEMRPELFVRLKREGATVHDSTAEDGWMVAYPRSPQNEWPIDGGVPYQIQVFDKDGWLDQDDLLFERVNLTLESFRQIIYEEGSTLRSQELTAFLQFEEVKTTSIPGETNSQPESSK
jgi:hypothetical protein